ncbi:MAG: C45 family peptidase [Bacteroidales bacterium]|nr:C45 family peptidase [Bacteroidales bacterium]
MRHLSNITIFLLVLFIQTSSAQTNALLTGIPPIKHQVELNNEQSEFFTVEVSGSSFERGYQHGKALRKIIRPAVNRFKYDLITPLLEVLGQNLQYDDYHTFFIKNTGLLKSAQVHAPDLVEEIRGIAEGANLPFEDVFIYNLNFDETFWVIEKMTQVDPILIMEKANMKVDGHCSHGSVWGNGKASVGYTLDWVRTFEGTQALIKHELPNGDILMTTTYAGTLIGHGINATHGYTFTPHSKFQLEHDVDNGLAQIFIYRKLIEAGSVEKAISFLHKVHPAAGLGYTLTDKNGTRAFEISSSKITEYKTDGNWMAMCNVARVNDDLSESNIREYNLTKCSIDMNNMPAKYWQYNKDSELRYRIIKKELRGKYPVDLCPDKWETIFKRYPINKPVNDDIATSNLWQVVEIDEEFITYYVSPGNPGNIPLECYRFKYR